MANIIFRIIFRPEEDFDLPYQIQYWDEQDQHWHTECWCIDKREAEDYRWEQEE